MTPKWLKTLFKLHTHPSDIQKVSQMKNGDRLTCYEDLDGVDYNVRDVTVSNISRQPDNHFIIVWCRVARFPTDPSFAVTLETDESGDTILQWQQYHLRPRDTN